MALPRSLRFSLKKEGSLFKKEGRKFYTDNLTIIYRQNNLGSSRFAFVVGKKISLKAVVRNRVKRRLSFLVRENLNRLQKSCDFLFLPKPSIILAGDENLKKEIAGVFARL